MPDATPPPDHGPAEDQAAGVAARGERFEVILDDPLPGPTESPGPPAEPSGPTEPTEPTGPTGPGVRAATARIAQVSALDLDRLPDREHVRLLVDAEQLDRLRAAGLPVRVQRSVPIAPLDPALIAADEDVAGWLAARLGPADPPGGEV